MTKIGLLGDVHANRQWIRFALWKFREEDINVILQVGDFGIYRDTGSTEFLRIANAHAEANGQTIYVTPGNHEDWDWITYLVHGKENQWVPLKDNILIAPRGHRWEWDGVSFVSLGGAPSVDRAWRVEMDERHPNAKNPLWHWREAITGADVDKVVAGGYADVMIAHDAPNGVESIDARIRHNPHGFAAADLIYAAEGRALMTEAFRGVAPATFIHGHYHFKVDEMIPRPGLTEVGPDTPSRDLWTNVIGLSCDESYHSLGVYDTETKTAFIWDTRKDFPRWLNGGSW